MNTERVHPNSHCLLMLIQTNDFVPLNTKDDMLKNDDNQTVLVTTDLHIMDEMG